LTVQQGFIVDIDAIQAHGAARAHWISLSFFLTTAVARLVSFADEDDMDRHRSS